QGRASPDRQSSEADPPRAEGRRDVPVLLRPERKALFFKEPARAPGVRAQGHEAITSSGVPADFLSGSLAFLRKRDRELASLTELAHDFDLSAVGFHQRPHYGKPQPESPSTPL